MTTHIGATKPLDGVRVLDLSRVLAGPLCTMMLGDMGAQVIKVERPPLGDETRGWGPPFDERGLSAYYLAVNRNKKSVVLELTSNEDRPVLERLIGEADVVVDNFLPRTVRRLGLDRLGWLERRRGLIWCAISGFGAESERPGYDFVIQGEQGWMSVTGEPTGSPMKVGIALADVVTGKDAAIAILASLSARERMASAPAAARLLEISLASSAAAALINVAQNAMVTGGDASRYGNGHANLVPYELFDTADRPIIVAIGNDSQWSACLSALGELDDLAGDASLRLNEGRVRQRERVVSRLAERLRTGGSEEWLRRLDAAGVPCGSVRTALEAAERSGGSALTGMPPSVPGSVRLHPPLLDEHGAAIRQLGWGAFAV